MQKILPPVTGAATTGLPAFMFHEWSPSYSFSSWGSTQTQRKISRLKLSSFSTLLFPMQNRSRNFTRKTRDRRQSPRRARLPERGRNLARAVRCNYCRPAAENFRQATMVARPRDARWSQTGADVGDQFHRSHPGYATQDQAQRQRRIIQVVPIE